MEGRNYPPPSPPPKRAVHRSAPRERGEPDVGNLAGDAVLEVGVIQDVEEEEARDRTQPPPAGGGGEGDGEHRPTHLKQTGGWMLVFVMRLTNRS